MTRSKLLLCSWTLAAAALGCSSETQSPAGASAGTGGSAAGAGGATTSGGASGATSGGTTAAAGQTGSAGASAGQGGQSGGGSGGQTVGGGGSGGASGSNANIEPACLTMDVEDGVDRATNNYIECDVEAQAIDFDVAANYAEDRDPGYDPAQTTVSFTDFGTAFSGFAVQECHPYCYRANLTLGVTFSAADAQSLKGEVLFAFPDTVAPIANAAGRLSLGWIYLDGPALPGGATLLAEMVLKKSDGTILVANNGSLSPTPGTWVEFKYFPIQAGFNEADLVNIDAIGFRITLSQAGDWQGVIYADHFQLRQ